VAWKGKRDERGVIMNRLLQGCAIAIVLTVGSATTGFALYQYTPPEENIREGVLLDSQIFSAGTVIPFLPNGARSVIIEQTQYFVSGGNWFLPIINEEGVRYQVVFAPV